MHHHSRPTSEGANGIFAHAWLVAGALAALGLSGCTLLNLSGGRAEPVTPESLAPETAPASSSTDSSPESEGAIVNPPAKTIRFDGRETVLGTAEGTQLATTDFRAELAPLLRDEMYHSAASLVRRHVDVAEQVIWERYASPTGSANSPGFSTSAGPGGEDAMVRFIARALSMGAPTAASWEAMLATLDSPPSGAPSYAQVRAAYINHLKTSEPADLEAEQLRSTAQRANHPLAMIDALRLIGLRELVAGRHSWAESLFLQAAEIADQQDDAARAAELWLMAAMSANRASRPADAEKAWTGAIQRQLAMHQHSDRPLNPQFWMRLEEQRPTSAAWPTEASGILLPFCKPVGCALSAQSPPELVVWTAVAVAQYDSGQPQLALVNYKKAERLASGDDVLWLRIAQSKCLAALGQSHAAAALLSGPAASANPAIASASTAALGSAKLQSGAYQQGAQLIAKALHDHPEADWPTRAQAEADLALAQLIIGDTDEGLRALHSAQNKFQIQRDHTSMLQSLKNELRILELEQRSEQAAEVAHRIRQMERL